MTDSATPPPEGTEPLVATYRLEGKEGLDGHLFPTANDAIAWSQQAYVQNAGYRLVPVLADFRRRCCSKCGQPIMNAKQRVKLDHTLEEIVF